MLAESAMKQRVQYATETVAGTAVPATDAFRSKSVTLTPKPDTAQLRAAGSRYNTAAWLKREWTEGSLEGPLDENDFAPETAWIYGEPDSDEALGILTSVYTATAGPSRTLEYGDSTAASKIAGCIVTDAEYSFGATTGEATVKANFVGGVWTDGVTLNGGVEIPETKPMTNHKVRIYMDDTLEDIGTTKLTNALKLTYKTGDLRAPVWTIDADAPSFSGQVETASDGASVELVLIATTGARALLTTMREGGTKYVRVEWDGGADKTAVFDFVLKPTDHARGEEEKVFAVTVPFTVVEDSTGFAHSVTWTEAVGS